MTILNQQFLLGYIQLQEIKRSIFKKKAKKTLVKMKILESFYMKTIREDIINQNEISDQIKKLIKS